MQQFLELMRRVGAGRTAEIAAATRV